MMRGGSARRCEAARTMPFCSARKARLFRSDREWVIRAKLEYLRQSCMDLPVEEVSELQEFKGKECEPGED